MENESFVLNVIPWKKEMVKKKKTKVGRPLVASGKLYVLVKTATTLKNEYGSQAEDNKPSASCEATQKDGKPT